MMIRNRSGPMLNRECKVLDQLRSESRRKIVMNEKKIHEQHLEIKTSVQESAASRYRDFELLEQIGSGGMGLVYKVRQRSMERICALKVLNSESIEESSLKRFLQEGRLICALDHPNIVKVYAVDFSDEKNAYLVMEWLEGKSLADYLKEKGTLNLAEFRSIISPSLEALSYAHQRGIIHRDIKPGNIFISKSADGSMVSSVKLIDFGIARDTTTRSDERLTRTGTILGSPAYLSPEQARGEAPAITSDIYSIGILMYECLTGMPPFRGDTAIDIMYKHAHEAVDASKLPSSPVYSRLNACILKCLNKLQNERFSNASELLDELVQCWDFPEPGEEQKTGKTLLVPASITAIVIVCAGLALFLFPRSGKNSSGSNDYGPTQSQSNSQRIEQARRSLHNAESLFQKGDKEKGLKMEQQAIKSFDKWISDTQRLEQESRKKLQSNDLTESERSKLQEQLNAVLPNKIYNAYMELGRYFEHAERPDEAAIRFADAAKTLSGVLADEAVIAESEMLRAQSKYAEAIKVLSDDAAKFANVPLQPDMQYELIKVKTALGAALFDAHEFAQSRKIYAEAWSKAKLLPDLFFDKKKSEYPACFIEILNGMAKTADTKSQASWYEQCCIYIEDAEFGWHDMPQLVRGTPNFSSIDASQFHRIAKETYSVADYYKTKNPARASELRRIAQEFESAR